MSPTKKLVGRAIYAAFAVLAAIGPLAERWAAPGCHVQVGGFVGELDLADSGNIRSVAASSFYPFHWSFRDTNAKTMGALPLPAVLCGAAIS